MEENSRDAPSVVRRRRKVNRMQKEQTPESGKLARSERYSDEESTSSTANDMRSSSRSSLPKNAPGLSAHRSKILNRRDKIAAAQRSQSQPKYDPEAPPLDVHSLMRVARRSLSSPRHKEESSDTSPTQTLTRPPKQDHHPPALVNSQVSKLELNLRRFEEERRKFEVEKRRFEQERRDLDKLRLRKLEEYDRKRIAEGYQQLLALRSLEPRRSSAKISDPEEKQSLIESFNKAQEISLIKKSSPPKAAKEKTPINDILFPPDVVISAKDVRRSVSLRENRSPEKFEDLLSSEVSNTEDGTDADDEAVVETKPVEPKIEPRVEPKTEKKLVNGTRQRHTKPKKEKEIESDTETENSKTKEKSPKRSWFSRLFSKKKAPVVKPKKDDVSQKPLKPLSKWKLWKLQHPKDISEMKSLWNRCIANLIILVIFCGIGGLIFRFVEGAFENFYKCGVKRVKRDFVDSLWVSSHNMREEEWKTLARGKLRKFEEELQVAFEAGMTSYSGQKAWSFLNSWVYCFSVVTTIGYGHIAPVTTTGRTVTILYSVIGIPIFLILLADFGKLFTRGIKFLWAYVRGLYYTGSCRRVRKTVPMQDMMRGMNIAYDFVRRPSQFLANADNPDVEEGSEDGEEDNNKLSASQTLEIPNQGSTPQTPMPSEIEIDDEFNLPISLALFILISYILLGAAMYSTWETWTFFESFYFVFISMSTIGFGDYVPNHPMFMMASIVYLVFGLSLTSMCINVVQLKLSDSFRQASSKIRETIGLAEAANSQTASPDLTSVHSQANDAEKKSPID